VLFFDSWSGIARVLIVGTLAYACLVLILRITGKRTLSKLNAFDFVVTVAFGSVLATILLNKSVALLEGVAALALLAALQYVVAWSSARSRRFGRLVKSEPRLLMHDGQLLQGAMKEERISADEIDAALRSAGIASPGPGTAVILETSGDLSVIDDPVPAPRGIAPPASGPVRNAGDGHRAAAQRRLADPDQRGGW
jgi:uncharacterized membrane protein YcaP (DUF421 family)